MFVAKRYKCNFWCFMFLWNAHWVIVLSLGVLYNVSFTKEMRSLEPQAYCEEDKTGRDRCHFLHQVAWPWLTSPPSQQFLSKKTTICRHFRSSIFVTLDILSRTPWWCFSYGSFEQFGSHRKKQKHASLFRAGLPVFNILLTVLQTSL